jgi:hypothetical protein
MKKNQISKYIISNEGFLIQPLMSHSKIIIGLLFHVDKPRCVNQNDNFEGINSILLLLLSFQCSKFQNFY